MTDHFHERHTNEAMTMKAVIFLARIFTLASFGLFFLAAFRAFKGEYIRAAKTIGLSILLFGIAFFALTNRVSREILVTQHLVNGISGNGMDSLEAYRQQMQRKCPGPILDRCAAKTLDVEQIHLCLYSQYRQLGAECGMFLSNTPLRFPPTTTDSIISGLLVPAGTEVYKGNGRIQFLVISKPWDFPNKHCEKGRVEVRPKNGTQDQLEVGPCIGDGFN